MLVYCIVGYCNI